MDWDIMFCSDELGALDGFLKSHIENTVSREQGIIKLFAKTIKVKERVYLGEAYSHGVFVFYSEF
ncbi:MAG: hypothetical protein LBB91_00755 [Clostridiales bacterium]|nr:hypothetical protein [Clostridiales bacterium]